MKAALVGIVILAAAILLYRSCAPRGNANLDPHAREQIEKAKRR